MFLFDVSFGFLYVKSFIKDHFRDLRRALHFLDCNLLLPKSQLSLSMYRCAGRGSLLLIRNLISHSINCREKQFRIARLQRSYAVAFTFALNLEMCSRKVRRNCLMNIHRGFEFISGKYRTYCIRLRVIFIISLIFFRNIYTS